MPRGRFINKSITFDRRFNALATDGARVGWMLAMLHLDVEGRILGDPAALKAILFPRRTDITVEDMEEWRNDWICQGMAILYRDDDGEEYLHFPAFLQHNKVNPERETASQYPEPTEENMITPDLLRSNSGPTPDLLRTSISTSTSPSPSPSPSPSTSPSTSPSLSEEQAKNSNGRGSNSHLAGDSIPAAEGQGGSFPVNGNEPELNITLEQVEGVVMRWQELLNRMGVGIEFTEESSKPVERGWAEKLLRHEKIGGDGEKLERVLLAYVGDPWWRETWPTLKKVYEDFDKWYAKAQRGETEEPEISWDDLG